MALASQVLHIPYDPAMDGEAVCYVVHTGKGAYWIKAPKAPQGRKRRAQKDEMIARIADAIEAEQPPGEVSMDGPKPERLNDTFNPDEY
jgi:hypothetical protein